jgi:hypothetical protein
MKRGQRKGCPALQRLVGDGSAWGNALRRWRPMRFAGWRRHPFFGVCDPEGTFAFDLTAWRVSATTATSHKDLSSGASAIKSSRSTSSRRAAEPQPNM